MLKFNMLPQYHTATCRSWVEVVVTPTSVVGELVTLDGNISHRQPYPITNDRVERELVRRISLLTRANKDAGDYLLALSHLKGQEVANAL